MFVAGVIGDEDALGGFILEHELRRRGFISFQAVLPLIASNIRVERVRHTRKVRIKVGQQLLTALRFNDLIRGGH